MNHPLDPTMSEIGRGMRGAIGIALLSTFVGCDRPGGQAVVPNGAATTDGICIGACEPDPGWGPVDCSQQNGIDTLEIESFDDDPTSAGTLGVAADLYTYTDGTAPLYYQGQPGEAVDGGGFQPSVTPVPLCAHPHVYPDDVNYVFHIFGGPFKGWGGGFGVPMAKLNGREPNGGNRDQNPYADPNAPKDLCCPVPVGEPGAPCPTNVPLPSQCPPAGTEFAVWMGALDVSAYDGVSFWARRGPNGQAGLRVTVGDKYTDDDINYLAQRQQAATGQSQPIYCDRVRECDCNQNHQACEFLPQLPLNQGLQFPTGASGYFCGDQFPPSADLVSVCSASELSCVGFNGGPSTCCGVTNCNQPYPAYPCDMLPDAGAFADAAGSYGDPQFFGRPCSPYAFATGVAGSYCFNPATDPPPAAPVDVCGDFWMTTVDLGTDWTFYKVPFTVLHQQGFGKKSDIFDLHAVSVVRFTFDIGWIDYWIDTVSFYREGDGGNLAPTAVVQ
jgi:hypothetical protein